MSKAFQWEIPFKYISSEPESKKQSKQRKQQFCDLGWTEEDIDVWKCATCNTFRFQCLCDLCERCEKCYKACDEFKALIQARPDA